MPCRFWIWSTSIWCEIGQAFGLAQSSSRLSSEHPANSKVQTPFDPKTYNNKQEQSMVFRHKGMHWHG
ncbi:hypothetical protein XFF6990_40022 [Xanthomonas citri pv. fuscans]|nr:hypothetical protein XFF6990_40022 [Xanthomonas citri pv. fuscans]